MSCHCPPVKQPPVIEEKVSVEIDVLKTAAKMLVEKITKWSVETCAMFYADSIVKLIKLGYTIEIPESEKSEEVALRVLRGLGHIEYFYWRNKRYVIVTPLGDTVRDFIKDPKTPEDAKLHALIVSSLPFSTKMRVVYGLYYIHGISPGGFYATLKDKLFAYDWENKLRYYSGVERLALEVLLEMVYTRGSSEVAVSETEILTTIIHTYASQFGGKQKLNELFRALNHHLRYKHRDRFEYASAAWEALKPGVYLKIDEALKKYGLSALKPLIDRLESKFTSIEYALYCLYSLPTKI
jgi:hypothetical protein